MRVFIFIAFFLNFNELTAQKEDYQWIVGYDAMINFKDTTFGHSIFDFNFDPVRISYDSIHRIDMAGGNASLCDNTGTLMVTTNGQIIRNGNNEYIEDTINYSKDIPGHCNEWESNNAGNSMSAIPLGLLGCQRIMLLPMANKVIAVYNTLDRCKFYRYRMLTSSMRFDTSTSNWLIQEKDKIFYRDSLHSTFTAVRHGNGRDWWLATLSADHSILLIFLMDTLGVSLYRTIILPFKREGSTGMICFSPDGNYISFYLSYKFLEPESGGFAIAKFDRCDGDITDFNYKLWPQPNVGSGIAFSSDSKYLYVSNSDQIFQYDLESENVMDSEALVSTFDGFKYYFPEFPNSPIGYSPNYCWLKLGPDGKIYVFPASASQRYMGVIEQPTRKGKAADMRQRSIFMPRIFTRTVPNVPEFRLGPLDGSPCDTLGIDNQPVAKFRYEPDSLSHLQIGFTDLSYFRPETWSWDFGDGSPRESIRHPYHSYAASGTYHVCLTVSNENSTNTSCRTITIGTSSNDDFAVTPADITLFPNPVQDYLLVTLGEYIPQHGQIMIYDISGRPVHTQRIYYGQNNVDMTHLSTGMYVWMVMDGKVEIKAGKVVKVE